MKINDKPTKIGIVIPCFNEEKNISLLIDKIYENFSGQNFYFLLVNNGSTDDTESKIKSKLKKKDYLIGLYSIKKNIGYGHGIYQGLLKIKDCKYIGWTHADLQTDVSDILKFKEFLTSDNIYLKGIRRNRTFVENTFTLLMSILNSLIFLRFFIDINGQPNIFHKNLLRFFNDPPKDFLFDLYAYKIAKEKKYIIKRFNVLFLDRIHGHSSWNKNFFSKIKFSILNLKGSFKIKFK